MNKLSLPGLQIRYYELNIFKIVYGVADNDFIFIIAPDSYVAVCTFCGLQPSRSILSITCLGPCVSTVPSL